MSFDEGELFWDGEALSERDLEGDEQVGEGGGVEGLEVAPDFGRGFTANGLGALAAAELGQVGPEDFEVIADFGEGTDGGTGGADLVTLFEGDGRGDAGDGIDAGFIHPIEELTGVGGERFDVASLAFGVEGIEGEGRFTGAAEAGDHDEVVGGEVEVEALEVVLAGAAEADGGRGWRRAHEASDDRVGTGGVNEVDKTSMGRCLPKGGVALLIRPVFSQQTLRQTATLSGVGLHGGNRVQMTFHPAPPNSGIRFRRVDLEGQPELEARVESVGDTTRSTTLVRGPARVHTVEHVLAAFTGCGVDNAVVELDAGEPPIGDGSALPYVRMIEEAGVQPQAEPRTVFAVTEPIELVMGDTTMVALPHDRLKVTCTHADRTGRYAQVLSVEITTDTWLKELAPARTFCFFEEIEALVKNGLIRGGSLENAVVIREDAVLTTEPLRFADEFVRHKILDVLGDLTLVGVPLAAHIVAVRPSHGSNCELARRLVEQLRRKEASRHAFAPPPQPVRSRVSEVKGVRTEKANGGEAPGLETLALGPGSGDIDYILRLLPHRYPFLMVDRVLRVEGNRIVALKNVSINEPYFMGHFPSHAIMPGVLQLEAMAQVAGILMLRQAENVGKLAYFMSAESVKWRRPVRPGDQLTIDVELTKSRGKIGRAKGVCLVGGETVSEAEVTFMLTEP